MTRPIFPLALLAAAFCLPALAQSTAETPVELPAPAQEVTFVSSAGSGLGTAKLWSTPAGTLIRLELQGLPPGQWLGFHIHQNGTCTPEDGFESAGEHWTSAETPHGFFSEGGPHSGDMANLYVAADGTVRADVLNTFAFLEGESGSIRGRSLMLHSHADDYQSQPSGHAGERLACAVIQ